MDPLTPQRRVVVDTSVVLGVLDPLDALHRPAAYSVSRARADGAVFVLPATVLAETLIGIAKLDPGAVTVRSRQIVDAFGEVVPIDAAVAAAAARRVADAPELRVGEALVLAVADLVGAMEVLTADDRLSGVDARVRIIGR